MSRAAELARSRASAGLDEDSCLAWFGVGRATLERIESGEVIPDQDLERRIDRFLQLRGGSRSDLSPPWPSLEHGAGPLAAGSPLVPPSFSGAMR